MAHFDSLTIFFPMFNEEEYVETSVKAANEICEALKRDGEIEKSEILVINDGSSDRTPLICEKLKSTYGNLKVINHEKQSGLGAGLKTGFNSAASELIFYCDADMPFDLHELKKALRLLRTQHADIVCAVRLSRRWEGLRRMIYSTIYNGLIRAMYGISVRDVNTPFKVCRRKVFDKIKLKSDGSFIDAELLVEAKRSGFRTLEFSADYFPRAFGTSTLSSFYVIYGILRDLCSYSLRVGKWKEGHEMPVPKTAH